MSNNEQARASFLLCPCAWILFAAFVSVVSSSFPVSGCKVITFLLIIQIILKKSFIKNCKRPNKAFLRAAGGVCAAWCKYGKIWRFIYVCTRVRSCVS